MENKSIIVIPCFNEGRRLHENFLTPFLQRLDVDLLLVDDGSTDGTGQWLEAWAARHSDRARVLAMRTNVGKGEAVRQGVLQAAERHPAWIGYIDSDGATPSAEGLRLLDLLRNSPEATAAVFGSRLKRLGADIQRHSSRHYLGRVFATATSLILSLPVYDSQCGAKFFRNTPLLRHVFAKPFHSRWLFDVELLGRLSIGLRAEGRNPETALSEIPLEIWHDIDGSKRVLRDYIRAAIDLWRMRNALARERAAHRAVIA